MLLRTLRPVFGQRGSALVLTMIVVVGMVALVSVAADNMFGSYKLSTINLDRQRARFAAETVAALVESKLVELATTPNPASSELDNLTKDFHAESAKWWGLRGACYTDSSGTYHQATKGLWINGCSVRWRIEPVRVYAQTLDSNGGADSTATFTINTELDPAKMLTRRSLTTNPTKLSQDDPGFFHFRIVAEAYTLKEARNGDEQPWVTSASTQTVDKSQVHVQAQRVVQLQVINLFKYALFHAQEDERGDIDLQTGNSFTILEGSVHSNASIYIRGGETFGLKSRNYHQMASGDHGHNSILQPITLGADNKPIDVVGVKGIFRMSKTANLLIGIDDPTRLVTDPLLIPIILDSTDQYNLNGDSTTSTRHNINGIPFTLSNDSRSLETLKRVFSGRVREQRNGGAVVKTLANIPEMAGRPLEYQRLADDPVDLDRPLYWNNTYTARGVDNVRDPRRIIAAPIVLTDRDFTAAEPDTTSPSTTITTSTGDGFDDHEAKGFYLERALFGQGLNAPSYYLDATIRTSIPRTGLVIRERPRQNANRTRPTLRNLYTAIDFDDYKTKYAAYLQSQYVVLFAGRNITKHFFNKILAAVDNKNYPEQNFIVTEDEFIDSRETSWMAANYGVDPYNYIGGLSYRQNVLTLNMRVIQDFLATTTSSDIDVALDGALARTHFNGLIYVHRTRRSRTFHVNNSSNFAWTAPTPDGLNLPFSITAPGSHYVAPNVTGIAGANYDNLTETREGDGPYETTRCAVRIRGGLRVDSRLYPNDTPDDPDRKHYAHINWDSTGANTDGLSNSGLTIVTPDRCYIWGDYNTTTHLDSSSPPKELTVPCAIFSDGITALSANWRDSVWQDYQIWGTKTYGNSRNQSASSTKYITSMVTNNVPNAVWNVTSYGTAGAADTIHLIEDWRGRGFLFRGSMVVLNEQRYSKCGHFHAPTKLSNGVGVFESGNVKYEFNTDLLTREGQPPFSPWGFQVTRVVSTVNVFDN